LVEKLYLLKLLRNSGDYMVLKVIVLGLPRSGTTKVYKDVCLALKSRGDVICIFEPTNNEVVGHIVRGIKHTHDVVGEVPYDYDRISNILMMRIWANTSWHLDWSNNDKPVSPFCGVQLFDILDELDSLPKPVVIKDVHAWVYLPRLVLKYRECKFILTIRSWESWKDSMIRRFKAVKNIRDKAGVGKFYRFIHNGKYLMDTSVKALLKEIEDAYNYYLMLVRAVESRSNVKVVAFADALSDDKVKDVIRWVVGE